MGKFSPAILWRAFFVSMAMYATAFAAPPPTSTPPPLAQVGKPNAAEAARILDRFRHSGWHGYVEFDLHALPRRGDEKIYHGRLWGGQNEQGAVTRIELTDGTGAVHRFLLQNGAQAGVWRVSANGVAKIASDALFEPLIPGVEVTAFDLQMPYLYWPGANVESVERVRGRPAYVFAFFPPLGFSPKSFPLTLVHAYFDAEFNVPVEVQLLASHQVLKTTSLVDVKRIGETWIPKSFDVRNDMTRDKTRFEVTAVALNLDFAASVFAPAALSENIPPPAADRIVHIGQ